MDEAENRSQELREQAAALRLRTMEANRAVVEELGAIWQELNGLAKADPGLRRACERIARDIALLEKLDLAFDTEWLDEAKHSHAQPRAARASAADGSE
ncbi:MAG: hypothetical protein WCF12_09840 [Propionicimonas sp.]